jgi:hypothetical protein
MFFNLIIINIFKRIYMINIYIIIIKQIFKILGKILKSLNFNFTSHYLIFNFK